MWPFRYFFFFFSQHVISKLNLDATRGSSYYMEATTSGRCHYMKQQLFSALFQCAFIVRRSGPQKCVKKKKESAEFALQFGKLFSLLRLSRAQSNLAWFWLLSSIALLILSPGKLSLDPRSICKFICLESPLTSLYSAVYDVT